MATKSSLNPLDSVLSPNPGLDLGSHPASHASPQVEQRQQENAGIWTSQLENSALWRFPLPNMVETDTAVDRQIQRISHHDIPPVPSSDDRARHRHQDPPPEQQPIRDENENETTPGERSERDDPKRVKEVEPQDYPEEDGPPSDERLLTNEGDDVEEVDPEAGGEEEPDDRVQLADEINTASDVRRRLDDFNSAKVKQGAKQLERDIEDWVDEGGSPASATLAVTLLRVGTESADILFSTAAVLDLGRGVGTKGLPGLLDDGLTAMSMLPAAKATKVSLSVGKAIAPGAIGWAKKKVKSTLAKRLRKAHIRTLYRESREALLAKLYPESLSRTYGDGLFTTYGMWRRSLDAGADLQTHHLVPQWLFNYGPPKYIALRDWAPATPLTVAEHLGAIHSKATGRSLEAYIRAASQGAVFYNKIMTKAQVLQGLDIIERYYRTEVGIQEYADAVHEFRTTVVMQAMTP
jgi:hypothetical protein